MRFPIWRKRNSGKNLIPLAGWFRYSPLQSTILLLFIIDIEQSASGNHKVFRRAKKEKYKRGISLSIGRLIHTNTVSGFWRGEQTYNERAYLQSRFQSQRGGGGGCMVTEVSAHRESCGGGREGGTPVDTEPGGINQQLSHSIILIPSFFFVVFSFSEFRFFAPEAESNANGTLCRSWL